MGGIELIRAVEDALITRTLRLVEDVFPERAMTLADISEIEGEFPSTRLLAVAGGNDVGVAYTLAEPSMRERGATFGTIVVRPESRSHGVGSALYRGISAWAVDSGFTAFESNVKEGDDESLAWAKRRGFSESGRELRLELDLTAFQPPPVDPPPGIEITTWAERPEAARGLYDVYLEASPDIPGGEHDSIEPFEDWLAHNMAGPGDKPEATFVAFAGDNVVGYSKFSLNDAQPTLAFHDLTGVKRAWRGRGIAGALKRTQMAWAKEHGYERLSTMNEERNEPIRKLNERYGYRPVPGRIFVRGPVA